jgi:cyclopropane-fatty-acyl-phospholipid synthase
MSADAFDLRSRLPRPMRVDVRPRPVDRFARSVVHRVLDRLEEGEIRIRDGGDVRRWGRTTPRWPRPVEIEVLSPRFYPAIAFHGTVGSGESWMNGEWVCSDLTLLIRMILANASMRGSLETGTARLFRPLRTLLHALRRNHRSGSRRNISAHYDLGNDFFALFLDPTMTYSSGVFETPASTMEEASIAKYERLCKAVDLRPGDHLLEIGTGWGGFAIHAARTRGCRVTTTTLSRAQREWACQKVAEAGLEDRIEVLLEDYRDLRGRYDKLVSIEMIEAVGHQYLPTYFKTCAERLAEHGRMALQSIVIRDELYEHATRNVDFIKRYIFPGGCLPSLQVIARTVAEHTDLAISGGEDITAHYAETLRRWRQRLYENAAAIRVRGYSETLLRMWEFYFCYCEAGFEQRHIGTAQLVFEKPGAGT